MFLHRRQITVRHTHAPHHWFIDDAHAFLADGAHGQFRLEGHPQLSYEANIERSAQGLCDLCGDRDAAAGKSHDHQVLTLEVVQMGGESPARVGSVCEVHGRLPGEVRSSSPD